MLFSIAYAQSPGVTEAASFVAKVNEVILYPLISLMMAAAFLYFLYGCFIYIINADNQTARAEGQKHIMWGIVGMLVMLSALSILYVVANTFGLGDRLDCANDPSQSGCDFIFQPNTGIGGGNQGGTGGGNQGGTGGGN